MNFEDKLNKILPLVEKPARYTGGEFNMIEKNPKEVDIRFAFCFPDVYEVGMSHLGLSILYNLINEREDTYLERVFSPWPDMEEKLRENNLSLYTLETHTPIKEFDILGFNLSYEMCFSNVLNVMDLGNINLFSSERGVDEPIVIAGGACVYNPEPLADFVDIFVIGEGEEVTLELLDLYKKHKKQGLDKHRFLIEASGITGIYVPCLYDVKYRDDGKIESIEPTHKDISRKINKRIVKNFDDSYFPKKPIVPFLNVVHDRVTLEIFRGCSRGCRFCQAGYISRPVREKSADKLMKTTDEIMNNTGYEEVSLCSLSSGDYSEISPLVNGLLDEYQDKKVSVSLPSLRVDSFDKEYAQRMKQVRKTGLTFAPEAGTQRLRDIINKNVTEQDLIRTVKSAFEAGWDGVKLYFMIGLPYETYEDLDGIADLVIKVREQYYNQSKELRKGRLKINISTASFIPKPCTPFQWTAQDSIEELRKKQRYLKDKLKIKGVKYNWHESSLSYLEAVFARGDRRLCKVLYTAFKNGVKFDAWSEHFKYQVWMDAFEETGVSPEFYALRQREYEEVLPWSHINCGVTEEFLISENEKAKIAEVTPDCRQGCIGCGLEEVCQ